MAIAKKKVALNYSNEQMLAYYIAKRDEFTIFGSSGHIPGAVAKREKPDQYVKGDSAKKLEIDVELFTAGQLLYRKRNANKDF